MEYKHSVEKDTTDKTIIKVTVPFKELEPYREAAYKDLAKDIKIQGFRPGKAPRHLIEPKIATELVNESVGRLLQTAAFKVMADEDYRPILQPEFDLKSMDPEKGIEFTFTFTNYPKVKVGDLSKIKVTKEELKITEDEVDTVIKSIIRSNIAPEKLAELTKVTKAKSKKKGETDKKTEVEDFELNDALIAELGYEKEKTLDVVREQVKGQLEGMKAGQLEDEYVNNMVEEAVKLSKFEIPAIMIDNEVEAARSSFNQRLEELNLDETTYLATQGRKMEDLEKEWKEAAQKRVGIDLVLVNLAMDADAMPKDADVESEINAMTDPEQKKRFQTPNGRDYVRMVLARRKGIEILKKSVAKDTKKAKTEKKTSTKKKAKKSTKASSEKKTQKAKK